MKITPEIINVVNGLIEVYNNDDRLVERVLTDIVENGYADDWWGNEIYDDETGDYKEGGMELDEKYMDELENYIESCAI